MGEGQYAQGQNCGGVVISPAPTCGGGVVCSAPSCGGGVVCSAPDCGGEVRCSSPTCGGGVVCSAPNCGGEEVCSANTEPEQDKEAPKDQVEMKRQEFMLRKTLKTLEEENNTSMEILDWDTLIYKHRESIRKEERERKEKQEKAEKNKDSWELLRMCRDFIKENGRSWKNDQRKRDLE